MSSIFKYIISGVTGGLIVLGAFYFVMDDSSTTVQTWQQNQAKSVKNEGTVNPSGAIFDFTQAADKAMKAVVHIKADESNALAKERNQQKRQDDNPFRHFFGDDFDSFFNFPFEYNTRPKSGIGSGVIMSSDGYIITNNHVVSFADNVLVTLSDGRQFNAIIANRDAKSDLALLKIEETDLPTLEIGDSDNIDVGQWVLAVGNPFNLTSTVTSGIVSALQRDLDIISEEGAIESFIQTDAAINPGNSGGALVDSEGNLIGINTAIYSRTGSYTGYSFAIPVNIVSRIFQELMSTTDKQDLANALSRINRGVLGVEVWDVDEELIEELDLKVQKGAFIAKLENGSAAQYAGLLPYDVITNINGKKVTTGKDLVEELQDAKAGDQLKMVINRKGKIKEINVILKPLRI